MSGKAAKIYLSEEMVSVLESERGKMSEREKVVRV